jgi:hypothetical protein
MICPPCKQAGDLLATARRKAGDALARQAAARAVAEAHALCPGLGCTCGHEVLLRASR